MSQINSSSKVLVAIMTYNRGQFLLNCLRSVIRNFKVDYTLHIYDDRSDDKETLNILRFISTQYEVYSPEIDEDDGTNKKVKGLHSNMNRALNYAINGDFDYLFIIQDDMQVIRPFEEKDLRLVNNVFAYDPNIVSVGFLFAKKNHQKDYSQLLKYHSNLGFFTPSEQSTKYMRGVADTGIFKVSLLRENRWSFQPNEGANIAKGRELGLIRSKLMIPVIAFLPWPSTRRSRFPFHKRTIIHWLDKFYHAGFHPYKDLGQEQIVAIQKKAGTIVFAEDFLELEFTAPLRKPWNYYDTWFVFRQWLTIRYWLKAIGIIKS